MMTTRFLKQIKNAESRYDSREAERKSLQERICRVKDGKALDCDLRRSASKKLPETDVGGNWKFAQP